MKLAATIAALALLGCAAEKASPQNQLMGAWGVVLPSMCVFSIKFDGGKYSDAITCLLAAGGAGGEVTRGTYVASDSTVTLRPTRASCAPDDHPAETIEYALVGDQLKLGFPKLALLLERLDETQASSGSIVFGCWDGDTFTPGELASVN